MHSDTWAAVDDYLAGRLMPADAALDAALAASVAAGLPAISVSPMQGRLLQMLARLTGARRILEIGTLGGYSTIWLARALPEGGRLISLEADPNHAAVARASLTRAGLDAVVEVRVGQALDSLPAIAAEGSGPFDLVFVDADKINTLAYVEWALRMSRPGTVIVVDNVIRDGAVADAASTDASVQAMQRFFEWLEREPRLTATAIQTVGGKGYDGMAIAVVAPEPGPGALR